MYWLGYTIESFPDGSFRLLGDTKEELIEKGLYKPGDTFKVTEKGILEKVDS